MNIFLKYFLAWFPMLLLAVINGIARDLGYKPYLGELAAHQLSTFTLLTLFAIYIYYVVKIFPPASGIEALCLGLTWTAMTLIFEFGFGRYRGNSWEHMLADYNLLKGRLWVLIPIWVCYAPYLFFKIAK